MVGSVLAIGLIVGFAVWLRRRSRRKVTPGAVEPVDESYGKAQLHSDDISKPVLPISELHPNSIHEMEGSGPGSRQAEKPANEAAAGELPGVELETPQ